MFDAWHLDGRVAYFNLSEAAFAAYDTSGVICAQERIKRELCDVLELLRRL